MRMYRVTYFNLSLTISFPLYFTRKCFRQKLYGFKGLIKLIINMSIILDTRLKGHMKVTFNFLN